MPQRTDYATEADYQAAIDHWLAQQDYDWAGPR